MDKKWEISKVSTPESIFEKILKKMPRPVGIVLFGADSSLKDEIYMDCVEVDPDLAIGYGGKSGNMPLRGAKRPFSEGRSVLTVMDGTSSRDHAQRHEVVTALRDLGAASVVGIFAKLTPKPIRPFLSSMEDAERNGQLIDYVRNSPTPDGLDYLVIVSEE